MKSTRIQLFLLAVTSITFFLWILSKESVIELFQDPLRSMSQIFSLTGLLYLMLSLVLSTRSRMIEEWLGGLDKVYNIHHIIGSVSFVLLMNHPILLAIGVLPSFSAASVYLLPGASFPYNLGIYGLYIMMFSFVFIVFIKLPYDLWKRSHQLLGFTGILGGFHALLIASDISSYFPLRYWMALWIVAGSISFIYIAFYYRLLGEVFVYTVTSVEKIGDVINILGKPLKRSIPFQPGQFGYFVFDNPLVGSEEHPFSFSSAPEDDELRISAKILGDYTLRLPALKTGDKMYIKGPFGKFGDIYVEGKRPLVWIVGGIGVTPFLSMLRNEARMIEDRKIILFYCFSSKDEGIFSDEIAAFARKKNNIEVYEWCSAEKGRFSVRGVADILQRFSSYDVQICGPGPMMDSLRLQFQAMGVNDSHVHYESFQMI